ncbi:metallophosphoesterase [Candidatus Woesearchaeota archaeon]|nr:metallophosphoesterase [Candidatus Woesearchaeota archaeon]
MNIVACTDLHADLKYFSSVLFLVKSSNADIVVCCGDFTVCERNIIELLSRFDKFPVPVFLVHGNHESEAVVKDLCSGLKNVKFLHKNILNFNGVYFVGWGGGGFSRRDKNFEVWWKSKEKSIKSPIVLVTHAPPLGTCLDEISGSHVGCESFTEFILRKIPVVVFSGHIEENDGKSCVFGSSRIVNPGAKGFFMKV